MDLYLVILSLNLLFLFSVYVLNHLVNGAVVKLLNLFIATIIVACVKQIFFRTVKLMFTIFTLLTSSVLYWELPEYIKDIIPDSVISRDDEFMEKFTQVLMISASLLLIYQNIDYDTVITLGGQALNVTTYPLRLSYRAGVVLVNWLFPPTIT